MEQVVAEIGTKIATGVASGIASGLVKEGIAMFKKLLKLKDKPIVYINAVSVEHKVLENTFCNKIIDLNTEADFDSLIEEDFLVLNLENISNSTITGIACKAMSIHAGDYEEYTCTGDGAIYYATRQASVNVRILNSKTNTVYLVAEDEDGESIIEYLKDTTSSTIYFQFEITTEKRKHEVYLSCYVENTTDDGYGTYNILDQE